MFSKISLARISSFAFAILSLLALSVGRADMAAAGPIHAGTPQVGVNRQSVSTAVSQVDWAQVTLDGFGNPNNANVLALEVFGGQLYAGVSNWNEGGQVWRSADGQIWNPVSEMGFSSENVTLNVGLVDMIEFNGQLYASTGWGSGPGQIWRAPDGTTWTQIEEAGFDDPGNAAITTFVVFGNQLYVGTHSSNGLEIWRSATGNSGGWTRVVDNGFGDANNNICTSLAGFDGYLYAAMENGTDGAEIWRTSNGTDWEPADTGGFDSASNTQTGGFAILDGYLYIGTRNDTTGGQIWRSGNGTTWVSVVGDGFGDGNNFKIEALAVFANELYAVTDNNITGTEVWRSPNGTSWNQINPDGFYYGNFWGTLWSVGTALFNDDLYISTPSEAFGGAIWAMVSPLHNFTGVSAGGYHTCAKTTNNGVQCWGGNGSGQIGDGTTIDRHTPVGVSGLSSGISVISAGGTHSCAVTSAGGAKCWGEGGYGQIGDNWACYMASTCATPKNVMNLTSDASTIAGGGAHSCALITAGAAKCWGYNQSGQLGSGSTSTIIVFPVSVSGFSSNAGFITTGNSHTCGLVSGGAWCWGNGGNGRLGNNSTANHNTPVNVSGLGSGLKAIAAGGAHACALTTAGEVKCWGDNQYGQVGDGTTNEHWTPVTISSLGSGVQSIVAGDAHTCALTAGGGVKCWGRNGNGQLGDGTAEDRWTPVNVSGLTSGVTAISAGWWHTCALLSDGGLKCWGYNEVGQLGNGTYYDSWVPSEVVELKGIPATYQLTVVSEHGSVVKNPNQTAYHAGDVVQLTATPNTGWNFSNWSGDLSSTANPDSVTIHGNTLVTANYSIVPVAITVQSTGAQDGWILESSEISKKGGSLDATATIFRLGDDNLKRQYLGILSFSTGAKLPDNAAITKVTLKVKRQGVVGGGNPVITFQGFMVDIKKGTFGIAALQVGDFQAPLGTAGKTYGPFKPALVGGWYNIDLNSGSAYINKSPAASGLTQIRLRFKLDDNNNAVANYLSLFSGNAALASRPQLLIEYYVP